MIDWVLDIWNQVMGTGVVEPTTWVLIAFWTIIVVAILSLLVGVKIALWILRGIKDWWKN